MRMASPPHVSYEDVERHNFEVCLVLWKYPLHALEVRVAAKYF